MHIICADAQITRGMNIQFFFNSVHKARVSLNKHSLLITFSASYHTVSSYKLSKESRISRSKNYVTQKHAVINYNTRVPATQSREQRSN